MLVVSMTSQHALVGKLLIAMVALEHAVLVIVHVGMFSIEMMPKTERRRPRLVRDAALHRTDEPSLCVFLP